MRHFAVIDKVLSCKQINESGQTESRFFFLFHAGWKGGRDGRIVGGRECASGNGG